MAKVRKLRWFGHVSRSSGLAKKILQSTVKGKRMSGRQKRGGTTILKSGQKWTWSAQLGQLKTGQGGKKLLQNYLWCPDNLPKLWDKIEQNNFKT